MDVKNHNKGRKKPVMGKRFRIAVFIGVSLGIVLMVFRYLGFVSKTIYEESVSHLTEVFHQIFRGKDTNEQLYQKISDTLTLLATGGERQ